MLRSKLICTAFLTLALGNPVAAQQAQQVSLPDRPVGAATADKPDIAFARMAADWISSVFNLPKLQTLPSVQRFPSGKVAFLSGKSVLTDRMPDTALLNYQRPGRDLIAYYDDATKTIYLPDRWNGATPAEMSVLVHALVHYYQNVGNRRDFDCAEQRKALPYEAQDRWLGLYDGSLSEDFGIDQATLMLITQCVP